MRAAPFALALTLAAGIAAADDLAPLSSQFDEPGVLSEWSQHAPDGFSPRWHPPRIEDGVLVLEPVTGGWFEDLQGGHLYRRVESNFIVTTRLRVVGTAADLPQTLFSLAGLFVR